MVSCSKINFEIFQLLSCFQVLSIISAVNAGILFLIQVVTIFGIQPDHNNNCYCPTEEEKEDAVNRNVTLPTWDNYCCHNNNNNEDNFSHFGPDNVIYLLVRLAMLPQSILILI